MRFALSGVAHALRMESSFRLHAMAAIVVVVVLAVTRAPVLWWAIGAVTVSVVMAAEMFNTAIEHLADHLHPQQHASIRIVKDCASGAVLLASIGAVVVAASFIVAMLS
jgi:diacylglycerol kinase (ATP)